MRRAPPSTPRSRNTVAREAAFLTISGPTRVADAPPLGCAAAARAGIPLVVVSNFTWDWIYRGYTRTVRRRTLLLSSLTIGEAYRRAREAGGCRCTAASKPSNADHRPALRRATRSQTISIARTSYSTLGVPATGRWRCRRLAATASRGFDLSSLDCLDDWTVVVTGTERPPDLPEGVAFVQESDMYEAGLRYEDLVAACDVVVTKPGYGIISECIANDTAMLYTSRGHFRRIRRARQGDAALSCDAGSSISRRCSPGAGWRADALLVVAATARTSAGPTAPRSAADRSFAMEHEERP